ncbi:MAG: dihydropteroate synthase [Candidatus Hodarchaeales archaeon]
MTDFMLGNVKVGTGEIKFMGVLNASPESFYAGSVASSLEQLERIVRDHIDGGASWIDIGAQSTAPVTIYGKSTAIPLEIEIDRIKATIERVRNIDVSIDLSIDTQRSEVAEMALKMECEAINDISGLISSNGRIAELVADHEASLILMATRERPGDIRSIEDGLDCLTRSISLAENKGVDPYKIIVDPGIGGWQKRPHDFDLALLRDINQFKKLNKPVLAAISRKSTVGKIINKPPSERLAASLAATIYAIQKGTDIIRTHDVKETVDAVTTYQKIINP